MLAILLPAIVLVALIPIAFANSSAVSIKGDICGMLDGNGLGLGEGKSHQVTTSNGNGLFTCKAVVTPSITGQTVKFNFDSTGGGTCTVGTNQTADWQETVSASGQAMLVCHLK